MHRLKAVPVINHSGFEVKTQKIIPPLKPAHHLVLEKSVAGDAPKDFIKVYEYGEGRKRSPENWPAYIAKVGHKWYPVESITEHLLTRVGQCFGLNMAESRLMRIDGQIRFLSRYFLRQDESLVHGAQVFAGYLEDDNFVNEVEKQNQAREVFTFQFVLEAVNNRFPKTKHEILSEYVRMLAFDAIVGNNDRHFYNWGVIVHAKGKTSPKFAPIYDSARALFWNDSENKLKSFTSGNQRYDKLKGYANRSKPKTGWDDLKSVNHFKLVNLIATEFPQFRPTLKQLYRLEELERVRYILDSEFGRLLSVTRRNLIFECLALRLSKYGSAVCIGGEGC